METISKLIQNHNNWLEFLEYKIANGHLSTSEEKDLKIYVENKQYLQVSKKFLNTIGFSYPKMKILNKQHSEKKRIVYMYNREEVYFLKFVAFHLFKYDYLFSENLCSFRRNISVKRALRKITGIPDMNKKYSYKVDISDYFNSVDVNILLPILKEALFDDELLFKFLKLLLENPYVQRDEDILCTKKGIMAGVPVSSFLANLYLKEMDEYFFKRDIPYMRYSDDIIVFADSAQKIEEYEDVIKGFLQKYNLTINASKEVRTKPGEKWEFLGFSYLDKQIDLSEISIEKIKKKMKRKARALLRWKIKNNKSSEQAVKAFIKHFNCKFFNNPNSDELTWARWYFSVITTDKSLRILDNYMQDCIRYIAVGNYSKKRFNFRYETMKKSGYKNLVNEYYRRVSKENV